jgi:hypothetical protein
MGSWLRENVLAWRRQARTSARTPRLARFLRYGWNRPYGSPEPLRRGSGGAGSTRTPMPRPHARIAVMSGFTPTMFMTRVRL